MRIKSSQIKSNISNQIKSIKSINQSIQELYFLIQYTVRKAPCMYKSYCCIDIYGHFVLYLRCICVFLRLDAFFAALAQVASTVILVEPKTPWLLPHATCDAWALRHQPFHTALLYCRAMNRIPSSYYPYVQRARRPSYYRHSWTKLGGSTHAFIVLVIWCYCCTVAISYSTVVVLVLYYYCAVAL